MCCLRYEYDTYKDFKARAPKQNATIHTPEGDFKVCELDMPNETVVLRVDKNKKVRIPLTAFDPVEEGAESQRPKSVGEAYYEYANASDFALRMSASMGTTERFTGEDKLAEKGMVRHNPVRHKEETSEDAEPRGAHRRRRARGGRGAAQQREAAKETQRSRLQRGKVESDKAAETAEPRRRRRRHGGSGQSDAAPSARRAPAAASRKRKTAEAPENAAKPTTGNGTTHRRIRRRSHKAGGGNNDGQA
jgi:hypothetical protein